MGSSGKSQCSWMARYTAYHGATMSRSDRRSGRFAHTSEEWQVADSFDDFFRDAARAQRGPYGYQERMERHGLPDVLRAPTGTGKTGIILAWLWRLLSDDYRASTPRRLVYALPQCSLVEQVSGEVEKWLANLGLTDQVALHVVMGGRGE